MVTFEKAIKDALEYFGDDELAANVFLTKYALTNPQGSIEENTPKDMHRRLAKEFARVEAKYENPLSEEDIFSYFDKFKYIIPQGSPMAGMANPYQVTSLSNCFVIEPPYDSYGGILKTDQEQAQLMKRRGGVGFDISTIRPKGITTANAAKTTDGIGIFMDRFSNTSREVAQGGRRGALMLTISVHHPEIRTFINIKRDRQRVTGANISIRLSDEFMKAAKAKKKVQLRWPVEDTKNPQVEAWVDAASLWEEIIESAHENAEPGLLFWDTIKRNSPADCYPDFQTVSTNPCFSGDTLIAVADGRNSISIRQLAEEGKDVPVYSVDPETGLVSIKTGRNPRISGYAQKLLRVHLDNGSYLDVTPNHEMLLRDGSKSEAKNLKKGDSLPRFKKELFRPTKDSQEYYRLNTKTRNGKRNIAEHRLISKFHQSDNWNKVYDETKKNGWVTGGLVVHHKDYDGLNNNPENLEIMSWKEHQQYHAEHDTSGEKNGRYKGFTSEEIFEQALQLTKKLGRRFSYNEWQAFAETSNLPKTFSKMHNSKLGGSPTALSKLCVAQLGYEYADKDPRLVRTLEKILQQGYGAEIVDNQVFVHKNCEVCNQQFSIEHNKREVAFCSHACSLIYVNSNQEIALKRTKARNNQAEKVACVKMEEQTRIFSSLKFTLNRKPLIKEWEKACKEEGIPFRLGAKMKYGFKSYKEVAQSGNDYNHKIVSIEELPKTHTVYNITVDNNHTLATITKTTKSKTANRRYDGVFTAQCGEIVLSPNDSCRLLVVNALSFVKSPFTPEAEFDWESYTKVVQVAQRLMDDVVDLELEAIDRILGKIEADAEPYEVKKIEIDLWTRIRESAEKGRRTGLGLTAIGDAIAAMNVIYGDPASIELVGEIYKQLALNSYRSSVTLAEERGAFPVYDHDLEKNHVFINRIMNLDPELKRRWQKHGRRNIANTTTAPAGSVSVMTQTSSGIEPVFLLSYKRRRKINPGDRKETRVDFVDDLGDKWQEYTVFHHGFQKWMEVTGKTDPTESPYHGATAMDINWVSKVKAQAAAQEWVCHSISNTTNVPEDTTVDTIKEIYMTGWESGCKGVTVYRDKCRNGVLVSTDEPKARSSKKFTENDAPKRPEQLPCDIHHMQVRGEKWNFFIGLYNDKPYEIFAGLAEHVHLPRSRKTGYIKKNGTYNLYTVEGDNELIIKNLAKVFDNATESAFTRTTSLALRHGVPVQYLVEQIEKGADKENEMFSLSKGLMRVLKQYIKDGTKTTMKKCSKCGSKDLAYQEGCVKCQACGKSKCG